MAKQGTRAMVNQHEVCMNNYIETYYQTTQQKMEEGLAEHGI